MSDATDPRLIETIQYAYAHAPAVRERFDAAGLQPEAIRTVDDLSLVPVLSKDEAIARQAADPPFGGMLAVPLSATTRLFFSPGPLYEPGPAADDPVWEAALTALVRAGFDATDIVLNSLSYHLTPAGYLFDEAFVRLGATVIPGGTGNSDLQLQLARVLGATGYVGTPSFLLSLIRKAEEQGHDFRRDFALRKAIVTAEPLPPALRQTLIETYGLSVCNAYGTAEFGLLATNTGEGMALQLLPEPIIQVVDPDTGQPVAPGEAGEVVVTNFSRVYPLIRFGTGDLAMAIDPAPGRSRQEERAIILVGRTGEAVKVRGMFLHPNQVRFAAAGVPGVRAVQAVITRPDGVRDHVKLLVETAEGADRETLPTRLSEAVQAAGRVRVDEVVFVAVGELAADGAVVVDGRGWERVESASD
jgi:phenylacetate-CoA ligase